MEESTLANEWLAKGERRGVLRARFGETVAKDTMARIKQETDLETLGRWINLAATAPTAREFQTAFNATATPVS